MTSRGYIIAVCSFLGASACLWLREPDDLSAGSVDATTSSGGGGDASPSGSSGTSGASSGGGGSSGSSGVDGAGPHCTGERGPVAVHVGETANCIDATEVTFGDYAQFHAVANPAVGQDPRCGWNDGFGSPMYPDLELIALRNKPISGIDWCDAVAYCKWAGKRLCAGTDAAPRENVQVNDDSSPEKRQGEWFVACSAGNTREYPHGATYDAVECAVDAEAPVDVDLVGCEGGYAGIHDMTGNVREWTDHCTPYQDGGVAEDHLCLARGGGLNEQQATTYECANMQAMVSRTPWDNVGIRCCSSWVVP